MRTTIIILFNFFLFAFCNEPQKEPIPTPPPDYRDSIKVGMTYDEVEAFLGKPAEILRGVNKVESLDNEDPPDDNLASLNQRKDELDFRIAILKSGERTYPSGISAMGSLLYVNWWYTHSQIDTIRYIRPVWRSKTAPATPIVQYFVNGRNVTKDDFQLVGDTVYWTRNKMFPYSREDWEKQKILGLTEAPEPAIKEIRKTPRTKKVSFIVPDTSFQAIFSLYSVTFDAASGRVVLKGFQPYQIAQIR